jgi:hypothetical protein
MFLDSTFSSIRADAHRETLLAQAEHHRLVRLARSARAGTRVTTPPPTPPTPPRARLRVVPADNHAENRRYAVSR